MVNYVNAFDIVDSCELTIHIGEISSVSIEAYLKNEDVQSGYDYNSRNTKIDEAIIDWLEFNIEEDNWFLDMCGQEINFVNNDDSWRFLEWLEEYDYEI